MYVVVGLTVGKSSVVFEGRYKDVDDVRDVHVSDSPRVNHVLQSFVITNDVNDLVLWSFDIPGYETHIYSRIKEAATLMLCPRVDNSTYLCPDASLVSELTGLLYEGSRSITYFVRSLDRDFVLRVLRRTVNEVWGLIVTDLERLEGSRGLATRRLIEKLNWVSDYMVRAADYWAAKGFGNEVAGVQALADSIRVSVDLKRNRRNKNKRL